MYRIKQFGSKIYTTHLIGYNEKYRYLFLNCNTRFIVYSLELEKVIIESRDLQWVETIDFTADLDYAICRSFKTKSNQLADAYLIEMSKLKDVLNYEYLGKLASDRAWKLSRFSSCMVMATTNKIQIMDCKTKEVIMEAENKFFHYKLLSLREDEEEDVLEVTYLGIDIREYYQIRSDSIQIIPGMSQDEKQYMAWKRYGFNRQLLQSRTSSSGVKIEDQRNQRTVVLEGEKLIVCEGQVSLSGNYYWTRVIRELDESEVISYSAEEKKLISEAYERIETEERSEEESGLICKDPTWAGSVQREKKYENYPSGTGELKRNKMYFVLFDLRTEEVVHILDDTFEIWGISEHQFDEKTGLIFLEESLKQYCISILQLEEKDYIHQKLNQLDFRKLQLASGAKEQFCESILFKGY